MDHITDHQARAVARLLQQHRDKSTFRDVVALLTNGHQAIEDGLWAILSDHPDTATGQQLEAWGRLLGVARVPSWTDARFRAWIRARISALTASGAPDGVLRTMLRAPLPPDVAVALIEQPPAGFVVRLGATAVPESTVQLLVALLILAKPVGVRGLIEHLTITEGETFRLDAGPGLDVGRWAGGSGTPRVVPAIPVTITSPGRTSTVGYTDPAEVIVASLTGTAEPGMLVTLLVDGAESTTLFPDTAGAWSTDVQIYPGKNRIDAIAYDSDSGSNADHIAVYALPPAIALNLAPDESGDVYVESHVADPMLYTDTIYSDTVGALLPEAMIDDGPMGSRFLRRAGEWAPPEWPSGRADFFMAFTRLFDQTQPIRYRYRMRLGLTGDTGVWMGCGVMFADESSYVGVTTILTPSGYNLSLYGFPEDPRTFALDDVVDVELESSGPTAEDTLRFRTKLAAETTWSAWRTRSGGADLRWPPSWYWQRGDTNHPGSVQDIGVVRMAGRPLAGASGLVGWKAWARRNMIYMSGIDVLDSVLMGGLIGRVRPADGGDPIPLYSVLDSGHGGADGLVSTGDALALASPPIPVQSGFRYRELRLQVYNVSDPTVGTIRIEVRDAATGALLPDDQVPGNSTGIVSSAPARAGVGFPTGTPTQEVDLRGVANGTTIFLSVESVSVAGVPPSSMPRLSSLTVGFEPIP